MSNNVATNTKNEGRCSFSRKALSVATAAVLATSMVPMLPAESAWAVIDTDITIDNTGTATIMIDSDDVPAGAAKAELYKGSIKIDSVEDDNNGDFSFSVKEGGVYTVKFLNVEDKVIANSDVDIVVTDEAANEAWAGCTAVPSQEADSDGQHWFKETGKAVDFTISDVLGIDGKSIGASNFVVEYYEAEDSISDYATATPLDGAPSEDGDYVVAAWPTDEYIAGVTQPIVVPFTIANVAESAEYSLYETDASAVDGGVSDTTFVYSGTTYLGTGGTPNGLGLAIDGKAVESDFIKNDTGFASLSDSDESGDYYNLVTSENVSDAKTYTIRIQKKTVVKDESVSEAETVAYVDLAVLPFDFSKASATVAGDFATADTKNLVVDFEYEGVTVPVTFNAAASGLAASDNLEEGFDLTATVTGFENAPKDTSVQTKTWFANKGIYTVAFSGEADAGYNGNYAFSDEGQSLEVRVVGTKINSFAYDGTPFSSYDNSNGDGTDVLVINKEDGESFDSSNISWTNTTLAADKQNVNYSGSNATLTITKDGEPVSSIDAAGLYKVTVATAPDGYFNAAGTDSFYVKVVNSEAEATVYMTFNGKPVAANASLTVPETGEAYAYGVQVKSGSENGGLLTEGEDYEVVVTNEDDEEVSEIKLAGTYTVTVRNIGGYDFDDASFVVIVSPKSFDDVVAVQPVYGYGSEYDLPTGAAAQEVGYAYTGEAVEPVFAITYTDADGEEAYIVLDESLYEVTYKDAKGYEVKASDLVKAADGYVATVTIDQDAFEAVYGEGATVGSGWTFTDTFNIVDTIDGGFSDVKASAWYADEATKARQLGYMTGLQDTNMLLPEASITRADVAVVLFRMAGGTDDAAGSTATYPTKFTDVAEDAYYAKAIDWAYKAGIVTGYDGTDSFGPNDMVTREQLATMLGRFAEKVQGKDVAAGAIEGYADADAVSDFAVEGMSWCVENGVFGVNTTTLDPQGDATRAQVAAIAVRVCPAVEKDA